MNFKTISRSKVIEALSTEIIFILFIIGLPLLLLYALLQNSLVNPYTGQLRNNNFITGNIIPFLICLLIYLMGIIFSLKFILNIIKDIFSLTTITIQGPVRKIIYESFTYRHYPYECKIEINKQLLNATPKILNSLIEGKIYQIEVLKNTKKIVFIEETK